MKERKEVESLVDYRIAFDRVSLLPREKLSIVIYKNKKDYEKDRFSSCCVLDSLESNIKMGVVGYAEEPINKNHVEQPEKQVANSIEVVGHNKNTVENDDSKKTEIPKEDKNSIKKAGKAKNLKSKDDKKVDSDEKE